MSYLIVGNSAAGLFAAEEIKRRDPQAELKILTSEQEPSYSRCLTTYFIAGVIPPSRLYLREEGYAEKLGLEVIYGARITGLDAQSGVVFSADGREWDYKKLLLSMGASAVKLQIQGANLPEVFTLRTMADAKAIISVLLQGARKAVVLGGGLVGLKTAYALRKRGLEVEVVVSSGYILSQMLDATAAGLIQKHLEGCGMKFHFHAEVKGIDGEEHVQGVSLQSGNRLDADLVIVGKGVSPNTEDLRGSGLEIGRGIRVNSSQATNLPHVYAAGDIAETWDRVRGAFTVNATWPNATTQGRIAGANMCGAREVYPGSFPLNSVDFFGLSAISAGITKLPGRETGNNSTKEQGEWRQAESLKYSDYLPVYQKLIWKGDVLKGYILIGDTSRAGVLTGLISSGRRMTKSRQAMAMDGRGALAIPAD